MARVITQTDDSQQLSVNKKSLEIVTYNFGDAFGVTLGCFFFFFLATLQLKKSNHN